MTQDVGFMAEAFEQAKASMAEGGIPIGAILVCDGEVIGRGFNRRVQHKSAIHHAEMNCFENAGRLSPSIDRRSTLYTTLSPCYMCAGAALLFGVKKIVVGENRTANMGEQFLRERGVELKLLDDSDCYELLQSYIKAQPEVWNEDNGGN
jgi:cytosine deaminase